MWRWPPLQTVQTPGRMTAQLTPRRASRGIRMLGTISQRYRLPLTLIRNLVILEQISKLEPPTHPSPMVARPLQCSASRSSASPRCAENSPAPELRRLVSRNQPRVIRGAFSRSCGAILPVAKGKQFGAAAQNRGAWFLDRYAASRTAGRRVASDWATPRRTSAWRANRDGGAARQAAHLWVVRFS